MGFSMKLDSYYAAMSDRNDRIDAARPHVYGGNAQVASLRAFKRYHKDATSDITDGDGLTRWVSRKQARVYGIVHRIALSPTGAATMAEIALEAGCTTSTVSRTIHKLEGWAMYAVEVRRGRNGGIIVHRLGWDRFYDYVHEARRKLKEARIRAQLKLASIIRGGSGEATVTVTVLDATFTGRVLYERAMLALDDPDGEYEAVRPLIGTDAVDEALQLSQDERRRQDKEIREAALKGDWERWEQLRSDRWNS
jgi:hypothetical protein